MQTDSRKATSLTVPNITLTSLSQVGRETYVAGFTATYDFHYDKSTDTEKQTSGEVIQTLEGKVTLKKAGATYVVANSGQKSITVINEDNQVKGESLFPEACLAHGKSMIRVIRHLPLKLMGQSLKRLKIIRNKPRLRVLKTKEIMSIIIFMEMMLIQVSLQLVVLAALVSSIPLVLK